MGASSILVATLLFMGAVLLNTSEVGSPESAVAHLLGIIKQSDNQETQQDNVQSDEQATSTSQSVTNKNEAQRTYKTNFNSS